MTNHLSVIWLMIYIGPIGLHLRSIVIYVLNMLSDFIDLIVMLVLWEQLLILISLEVRLFIYEGRRLGV